MKNNMNKAVKVRAEEPSGDQVNHIAANDNAVAHATAGLRFLSVCSGIEAASVAWKPLGWRAVAFSEIEKFPSAVLGHHYPDVPNLGDFTKIDTKTLGRVDILCGGTPCQAFSVAGLRGGLNDSRGNLTLAFVELAHELAAGNGLRNVVWENVVGVLSDKTNAFGSFLAGLVGADSALQPPTRGKWGNAGLVSGPKGRAAWRIVDAQYFGVAQRRRRVLVVADFGNGADPAQVLFELDGMQRHSAPSREARKDVAPTISARTKGGGGLGTDFDLDGGLVEAAYSIQAGALRTNPNSGPDGVGVQRGVAYTLEARTEVQAVAWSIMPQNSGKDYKARVVDVAQPLMAGGPVGGNQGGDYIQQPVAYAQEIARCVATREGSSQDYETTTMVAVDVAPTMRAGGNSTGGDRPYGTDVDTCDSLAIARTVAIRGRDGGATAELGGEVATALRASQGGGDKPHVLAFQSKASSTQSMNPSEITPTLDKSKTDGVAMYQGSAVRRLTPRECERLQGFQWLCSPDYPGAWQDEVGRWWSPDYTNIPRRGKPNSPDGPRYKALGNSWAVPKFTWLGRRIAMHMPARQEVKRAA